MNQSSSERKKYLIMGCGKTGLSCLRFLVGKGQEVTALDTRLIPPLLDDVYQVLPENKVFLQHWDMSILAEVDSIVISPGVSRQAPSIVPLLTAAQEKVIPIIGDIELFYRYAEAPIIAITGSNGKSTVTTLLAKMAQEAGMNIAVGGNLGVPVLELLAEVDAYILELSSFQLESVRDFSADVAVVLNISPDHLERYPSVAAYQKTKERIYQGKGINVINKDMADLMRRYDHAGAYHFTRTVPNEGEYGCLGAWLMRGSERLLRIAALPMLGEHNVSNVLAALCLGEAMAIPLAAMKAAVLSFHGLPHRVEKVAEQAGVQWFDDSKGTNVGAASAGVNSLPEKVVLIAGGVAKEHDFSVLVEAMRVKGRAVILIGQDAPLLGDAFEGVLPVFYAQTMEDAVRCARQQAMRGDCVLLSPACASFDMFKNYSERGKCFQHAVVQQAHAVEVAA